MWEYLTPWYSFPNSQPHSNQEKSIEQIQTDARSTKHVVSDEHEYKDSLRSCRRPEETWCVIYILWNLHISGIQYGIPDEILDWKNDFTGKSHEIQIKLDI